jgi:GNAT superfamily N-acetyltransferase
MDDHDWGCALEIRARLAQRFEEPSDYFTEYNATVQGGRNHRTKVGTMRYSIIDLWAAEEAGHLSLEVMDSYSADLAEFSRLVNHRGFVPSIAKMVGEVVRPILVIQRIEIDPAHRGHGLGLKAISIACENAGIGCCLAALIAFPSQWHGKPYEKSKVFARDRGRLSQYYEKAGFVRMRRAGIMVRPLPLL